MWALVEAPLRRPKLVVIPLVLILTASVAASYMVREKYVSSTLILVEAEKVPDSFVTQVSTDDTRKRLFTINQEVNSRTRLERVLSELNPYPRAQGAPLSARVEWMRSAIRIRVRGNDAFAIEYIHHDPEMAMKVANRLTTLFIEESAIVRAQQVESATRFIETQLDEARKELEAHEAAVGGFKHNHMGTLPEQLNANLATLSRLQLEEQSVSENLRAAQDRLSLLETQGAAPASIPGVPADLRQLRAQLQELRSRYTDEHPDVRTLAARIASLEAAPPAIAVTGLPGSALAETQLEVRKLMARRDDIERRMAEIQGRVDRAPRTEQQLATLTRDYTKLSENYLRILNKKLDAQMAEKLEQRWKGERFRVLDPANRPEEPFFPKRWQFAVFGLLAGLCSGLGLAMGVELLDRSIRSPADLEDLLGRPALVTITHVPRAPRESGIWKPLRRAGG